MKQHIETLIISTAIALCVLALLSLWALAVVNDGHLTESMHKGVIACVQAGGNPVECRAAFK